ncbi:MAG TPA: hypothetical protein VMW27_04870, partial [Thermoanaerobaculia bacterium]|nr:hypothetical protein [Thermoanaerobaculia bacterium]
MAEPLPLADLLELLRERKLEIGVREHLAVGRLLSRWDDTDIGALRDALAAVLARNPEEVAKVREAFDELYATAPPAEKHGGSNLSRLPERRRPRPVLLAAAAVALALLLGALLWPRPERPAEKPIESRGPTLSPPAGEVRPPKPSIPDVFPRPNRERVLVVAAVIAGGLLFGLYQARLRRATERAARRQWYDELEELADPQGYELELGDAPPPFSSAALEEAATLLGRRAPTSTRHGELDAERTVERTLRAGLAPQVVFRSRSAPPPILVLEDIGSEMDPWQGRVSALFAGLAARGAPLDRWQFHAGADRVFRSLSDPPVSLRQLARLRGASPLLVVSAGEGVLEGREGKIANWVEQLAAWPHRAWLHPVGDPGSWRPVLRPPDSGQLDRLKIPRWPMTAEGILAVARHLGHGRPGAAVRATYRTAVDRPVAPLDVDRLRWLLALAPRRNPELLDRLRRRFCPHVPPSAMLEALDAPPLTAPLGLPPEAAAVHVVIADFLAASEPEPGTAAHERWRLDRALQ